MKMKRKLILVVLLIMALGLTSCGGKEEAPVVDQGLSVEEETGAEESQGQMDSSGAGVEEADLPEDFPEAFPLPENAKVGSAVNLPGDQNYRIFFAFPESDLEEILTFYQSELPAEGWTVAAEGPDTLGYGMWVTHPEFEAKLAIIEDEYGVVLDLSIAPLGELEEAPGSSESYGESEGLGESGGDFPSDFPVPSSFTTIDLPAKLAEEGYQLAFNFPDMAELAIIELSTALMTGGWEIGDFEVDSMTASYMIPFTGPGGFQGYALLTAKPDVAGLSTITGSVIALHAGAME